MTRPPRTAPVDAASRWPVAAAIGSSVVTVAGTVLLVRNGQSILDGFNLALVVVGTVYAVAGALIITRVPGNRIGAVFLVAAWLWAATLLLDQYSSYGALTAPGTVPATGLATWLANWLWVPGTALLFFAVPVLFPDGRLPSRRWRPIVLLVTMAVALGTVGHAAVAWPLRDGLAMFAPNFTAADVPTTAGTAANIGDTFMFLVAPLAAIWALVVRYRRSRGVVRQQMRWFIFACVVLVAASFGSQLLSTIWPNATVLTGPAAALLPIAILFAMLRYRLYDIDGIISRSLSWAILSATLAAMFAVVVVGLQAVLAGVTRDQTLAVAMSTLVAAAVAQPLRRRIQHAVDRRFNRARIDADATLGAFAVRLRDEVDMAAIRGALVGTVDGAVHPARFGVWVRHDLGELPHAVMRPALEWPAG